MSRRVYLKPNSTRFFEDLGRQWGCSNVPETIDRLVFLIEHLDLLSQMNLKRPVEPFKTQAEPTEPQNLLSDFSSRKSFADIQLPDDYEE